MNFLKKCFFTIVVIFILFITIFILSCKNESINLNRKNDHLVKDILVKDIFYRDLNIENMNSTGFQKEICLRMEDIYLQYNCLRLNYRPHMRSFITKKSSDINFNNFLEECAKYDEYHGLFCTYLYAAKLAKININKAEDICDKLKNEGLIGECKFYIISSYLMGIKNKTSEKIDFTMNFCKKIQDESFKSECYYILADELALLGDKKYLKNISDACLGSYLTANYFCFHHVTFFMHKGIINEFCELVNTTGKKECYIGAGKSFLNSFIYNVSMTIKECNKISNEYKSYCFEGLGEGFGPFFVSNISGGIKECNKISSEYRGYCIKGLINYLGLHHFNNKSIVIKECNEISNEYKEYCFEGLSDALKFHYGDSAIEECNKFPLEYINICIKKFEE